MSGALLEVTYAVSFEFRVRLSERPEEANCINEGLNDGT